MRILFVVPYPPSRVRVRPYELLRALCRHGHELTVATLCSNSAERADADRLRALGLRVIAAPLPRARSIWSCLRTLPTGWPLQASFCWSPALARRLRDESRLAYDVAHVEHLRGARYALALRGRLPVVWDSVDCVSYLFEQASRRSRSLFGRWVTRFELPRTRAFEQEMARRVNRVLLTSPVDRAKLLSSLPEPALSERVTVLPNGVDTDHYRAGPEPPEPERLIFTGKLSYHANLTAALELIEVVMPRVWRTHPGARLSIAGWNPGRQLRSAIAVDDRVELCANVPDLRPHLERASIALAPMAYGAGIQMKVLEAMSMSRPVVASSSAVNALRACPGSDYLRANAADEFAHTVARLLDDPALRARLGRNGRRYVERHHQWDRAAARLEELYAMAHEEGGVAL